MGTEGTKDVIEREGACIISPPDRFPGEGGRKVEGGKRGEDGKGRCACNARGPALVGWQPLHALRGAAASGWSRRGDPKGGEATADGVESTAGAEASCMYVV